MSIRGGYTAHLTPEDDLGFLPGVRSYESLSYPLDPFSAYICTVTSYLFLPVMQDSKEILSLILLNTCGLVLIEK